MSDDTKTPREALSDRIVLLIISAGLIVILLTIIIGLFVTPRALPNWAENVLVSVATASALSSDTPLDVTVTNPPSAPVPVEPQGVES
jgi:hypothetical protein